MLRLLIATWLALACAGAVAAGATPRRQLAARLPPRPRPRPPRPRPPRPRPPRPRPPRPKPPRPRPPRPIPPRPRPPRPSPPRPRPPRPRPPQPPSPKPPQPRPPPRPRPPRPPPPPPSPPPAPVPPAEAAWHAWLRWLHAASGFSSPAVGPGASSIAKLMPQTFWYSLFVEDAVPAATAGTDAADMWSNGVTTWDPLWLRPEPALLSDALGMLQLDGATAALASAAALSALGTATSGGGPFPGYTAWVQTNLNNEWVPGWMPAWAWDGPAYTTATQQAQAAAGSGTWPVVFALNASRLAPAVSWAPYTLDGSTVLAPAPGSVPGSPGAYPARRFLDVSASDLGVTTRVDLVPGLTSFRCVARSAFFGRVGPQAPWFDAADWAGPYPADSQATAQQYFAARSGMLPTVPRRVAALFSPTVQFWLRPEAYAEFKTWWTNATEGGVRRLDVLAWSVKKSDPTTGTVSLQDGARRVEVTLPEGRWHRVAQVQEAVAPATFLAGLG